MIQLPAFSFTIPSIHDDTVLDCRIYHPAKFLQNSEASWRNKGAVIAHPYAPLGGCYDDPIVHAIVEETLGTGFVVGTFNFRGAGCSKGRTSWTARPELSDYISFVGFFVHYLNGLRPPASIQDDDDPSAFSNSPLSPIESSFPISSDAFHQANQRMILILGGYSYGSLITTHLPSTKILLEEFAIAKKGSAIAEIRFRALYLSNQRNREAQQHYESRRGRSLRVHDSFRSGSHSMTMGGEETEPGIRRPSRESRRSVDMVRRSMDHSRRKLGLRTKSSDGELPSPLLEEQLPTVHLDTPQTCYLLISPLLPPISMFITMFSKFGHAKEKTSLIQARHNLSLSHTQELLLSSASLAIYGDSDFFTSQNKLRKWAERLAQQPASKFRFREILGAGHFWAEDGVEAQMKKTISSWIQDITN